MGIGPVPAVEKLFARTGPGWDDIDLVELNEAFARPGAGGAQGLGLGRAATSSTSTARASRSAIPIGATGGRILANLLRELQRRDGRYGLETMCIGGGQGIAAVFEGA